eukprot:TRINITY_DN20741_c0_g1_i3.p1 TRINITY_DN20741_c0_g1~~TRINITY_DN20741_c0_g1_i3.p1  ORF type:complete len:293 (-),score=78.64 TRINITY_DN20741_c0_g1_i3:13-891(-)
MCIRDRPYSLVIHDVKNDENPSTLVPNLSFVQTNAGTLSISNTFNGFDDRIPTEKSKGDDDEVGDSDEQTKEDERDSLVQPVALREVPQPTAEDLEDRRKANLARMCASTPLTSEMMFSGVQIPKNTASQVSGQILKMKLGRIDEKIEFGSQGDEFLNPCILAVDDTEMNLVVLARFSKDLNLNMVKARNGKGAVDIVAQLRDVRKEGLMKPFFKIIFMDCNMPVLDGFEATKQIKEIMNAGGVPTVPIIALTSYTDPESIDKCYKSGMDLYVSKPITKDRFHTILREHGII